jgi:hypothetical protein
MLDAALIGCRSLLAKAGSQFFQDLIAAAVVAMSLAAVMTCSPQVPAAEWPERSVRFILPFGEAPPFRVDGIIEPSPRASPEVVGNVPNFFRHSHGGCLREAGGADHARTGAFDRLPAATENVPNFFRHSRWGGLRLH